MTNSPDPQLLQMLMGFRITQLLHVAATLGVADALAKGEKSAVELAADFSCDAESLYRLLRALANVGVLAESSGQRFELTALGDGLRSDETNSLRPIAMLYGQPWLWNAYGELLHSVRTGEPALEHTHGQRLFEYLDAHGPAADSFNAAMTSFSAQETAAILNAYDFSSATHLVDVGGGHGRLLAAVLDAHPRLRGTLFDLPQVVGGANELRRFGTRCAIEGGDFFTALPGAGDVYLLKSVVHNWPDGKASQILQRCREAMGREGRLLLIERVVGEPAEASEAKLFDINMLVVLGGRERTRSEYAALLERAGFQLTRVAPSQSPLSVIVAQPA